MIKFLILLTISVLASANLSWTGNWNVLNVTGRNTEVLTFPTDQTNATITQSNSSSLLMQGIDNHETSQNWTLNWGVDDKSTEQCVAGFWCIYGGLYTQDNKIYATLNWQFLNFSWKAFANVTMVYLGADTEEIIAKKTALRVYA